MPTNLDASAADVDARRNISKTVLCFSLIFWPGVFLYVLAGALRWRHLDEEQRLWANRYAYGLGAVFAAAVVVLALVVAGWTPGAIAVSAAMLTAFAVYTLFF